MSLACPIGPEANILIPSAEQCKRLVLPQPILSLCDLELLKATKFNGWKVQHCMLGFSKQVSRPCAYKTRKNCVFHLVQAKVIDMTFDRLEGPGGLQLGLTRVCNEACKAAEQGFQLIILSDRAAGAER